MNWTLYTTFPTDLEEEWNALLAESASHVPFLRFEYLSTWWQTRGGGEWSDAELCILAARQDNQLVGIAPLFRTRADGRDTLLLLGSIEISDYLDLICRPADLPEFLEGLLSYLKSPASPKWEALDFFNILEGSPTLPAVQIAAEQLGFTVTVEKLQHSPFIPLPGDWETYLAGIDKKQRHEIRRKMRRAEESPAFIQWRITTDPAQLETDMETFLSLMAQDPDKAEFLTETMREHMRLTMRCAFEAGCLQLAFLDVDHHAAAAYFSFHYLDRLWIYNSGLDRAFMEYSPGWVLLGYLLQWANENGVREFDFMRGDEEYKYRFGAIDRLIYRITISK